MELSYAFFAHAAEFSADGRLSVLGGDFDIVRVPRFPAVYHFVTLVLKVIVEPVECNVEHVLTAQLLGPDGAAVPPDIEARFTPKPGRYFPNVPAGLGMAVHIYGLTIPEPGDYELRMQMDGKPFGKPIVLHAVQESQPAP